MVHDNNLNYLLHNYFHCQPLSTFGSPVTSLTGVLKQLNANAICIQLIFNNESCAIFRQFINKIIPKKNTYQIKSKNKSQNKTNTQQQKTKQAEKRKEKKTKIKKPQSHKNCRKKNNNKRLHNTFQIKFNLV